MRGLKSKKLKNDYSMIVRKGIVLVGTFMAMSLIGCGSNEDATDEIKMEQASEEYQGENYEDVVAAMNELGFINIETKEIDDLVLGWLTKEYSVENIVIGDKDEFENGDVFNIEDKVVISYHVFKEDTIEEEEESTEENVVEKAEESVEESVEEVDEKSIYEQAYKIRFTDYEIYYLIDEDEQTVTRFAAYADSEYAEGLSVYTYAGDFNDGIEFGSSEEQQRAHYKYTDIDTTLIVWSGDISNEASRTDADGAEEYMNKLLDEGRLVVME